jgi:hypothetical protein
MERLSRQATRLSTTRFLLWSGMLTILLAGTAWLYHDTLTRLISAKDSMQQLSTASGDGEPLTQLVLNQVNNNEEMEKTTTVVSSDNAVLINPSLLQTGLINAALLGSHFSQLNSLFAAFPNLLLWSVAVDERLSDIRRVEANLSELVTVLTPQPVDTPLLSTALQSLFMDDFFSTVPFALQLSVLQPIEPVSTALAIQGDAVTGDTRVIPVVNSKVVAQSYEDYDFRAEDALQDQLAASVTPTVPSKTVATLTNDYENYDFRADEAINNEKMSGSLLEQLEDDQKVLLSIDKHAYTLQLISDSNPKNLEKFVAENNLKGKVLVFHRRINGQEWFSLIYGVYASHGLAQAAQADLPLSAKIAKPWVRQLATIQQLIDVDKKYLISKR